MSNTTILPDLVRYRDQRQVRTALIVKQGRKWMQVLVIEAGSLKLVRRPLSDTRYMTPMPVQVRRVKASLRRLARKKGTPRKVRQAVRDTL